MKNTKKNIAPSKSARKRASTTVQKIGEKLCSIPPNLRNSMNLPEDLTNALAELDTIATREGARRQRQYIGKLMREIEPDELLASIGEILENGCPSQALLLSIRDELRSLVKTQPITKSSSGSNEN